MRAAAPVPADGGPWRVLAVSDGVAGMRDTLPWLAEAGFDVHAILGRGSVQWFVRHLDAAAGAFDDYDLVVVDQAPRLAAAYGRGPDLIGFVRERAPAVPILVVRADADHETAAIGTVVGVAVSPRRRRHVLRVARQVLAPSAS